MRHRANTSVGPYCQLFNTVATAYNGKIVMSVRMRSDGVVKTTFGLLDLQFLVPLSLSLSLILRRAARRSWGLASRSVGAQMLSALT